MKKDLLTRTMASILVLAIALPLSSCGNTKRNDDVVSPDNDTSTDNITAAQVPPDEAITISTDSIAYASSFSDGYAWNIYSDPNDGNWHASVIDITGKMAFQWNTGWKDKAEADGIRDKFSYANGYVYIHQNDKFYVLDAFGKILYSCDNNESSDTSLGIDTENNSNKGDIVSCYADGYTISTNYSRDFDSAKYTYTVYAPDGTSSTHELPDSTMAANFSYLDNGIFWCFYSTDGKHVQQFLYNAITDTVPDISMPTYPGLPNRRDKKSKNSNITYAGCSTNGSFGFFDQNGKYFSCVIPTYSPNAAVDVATYLDKAMIMVNDKLYLYIPATNELKNITIPYAQKIMINNISMFTYGEEKVVIPVQGTDEEKYVMVINENGELLSDPIPAYDYSYFSEDRLIVNTDSDSINVYDDKMNLVYSDKDEKFASEQIETLDLEPYANGVAVAYEHRGPDVAGRYLYLDPDGNVLFDKLDASSAIELQLNIDS